MSYDKHSSYYEERWKGYLTTTHAQALEFLSPQKMDIVLDASGGTGLFAFRILKKVKSLTLIDLSAGMLTQAEKKLGKKVRILKEDVQALSFAKQSFTKIICTSAFHHYRNPKKVLSEFYRVLKPGGQLVIVDWCNTPLYFKIYNLYMKNLNRGYVTSYTIQDLADLMKGAGFQMQKQLRWRYHLWSLMALSGKKQRI